MGEVIRSLLAVLALIAALMGCSSDSGSDSASQGSADSSAGVVPAEEAHDLVENGAVLIDVRSADEYAAGHIEGAQSVPLESGDFDAGVEALDPDAVHVVYGDTDGSAEIALERMTELGITNVVDAGGLDDLADVVGPVVTGG